MGGSRWSAEELAVLRREWHEVSAVTLKPKLPRRSWIAIRRKAVEIGLPLGIPQGRASVSSIARRCGVDPETMREILEWGGVQVAIVYTSRNSVWPGRHDRRRHVDIDDALNAFARWLRAEHAEQAAARLGTTGYRLRERAQRAGVNVKDKRVVRLSPEQWDRLHAIPPYTRDRETYRKAVL